MTVRYERTGPVAVITIDRPERRNAVDRATADALRDAWRRFDADPDALVGVLTGTPPDFSAGADLRAFDLEDRPEGYLGFTRMSVSKPTIAAICGHAVAGGLEMALWCDIRVADATARLGCLERRFGVPLVDGGTQRLPRVVGLGRALDLILTGRIVEADEAHRIGLVDRVVARGEHVDAAVDLAATIAAYPQATLRTDREAVYARLGVPLAEGLEIERRLGNTVLHVAAEGAARFARGEGRHGAPTDAAEESRAVEEER